MNLPIDLLILVFDYLDTATLSQIRYLSKYTPSATRTLTNRNRVEVLLTLPHVRTKLSSSLVDPDNWTMWLKHSLLSMDLVDAYHIHWNNDIWDKVSTHPHLTPDIIKKYHKYLNMNYVCANMPCTSEFVEACAQDMQWHTLCLYNHHITVPFIKKYYDNFNVTCWNALLNNKYLPLACFEQWPEKLPLEEVYDNIHLTPELACNHSLPMTRSYFESYRYITIAIVDRHIDWVYWDSLSANPYLSSDIIDKYFHRLNLEVLSSNSALTPALIDKYHQYLDWHEVSKNRSLTQAVIEKYHSRIHWEVLCRQYNLVPLITLDLIERYYEWMNWSILCEEYPLILTLVNQCKYLAKVNWLCLADNPVIRAHDIDCYDYKWDIVYWSNQCGWSALSKGHFLKHDDISTLVTLIEKYQSKWDWLTLSYACLEHRWELILEHPEWPWSW